MRIKTNPILICGEVLSRAIQCIDRCLFGHFERSERRSTGVDDVLRALGRVEAVLKSANQRIFVKREQVAYRQLAFHPSQLHEVQDHVLALGARLDDGFKPVSEGERGKGRATYHVLCLGLRHFSFSLTNYYCV